MSQPITNTVSTFIDSQLPQFVREDNPNFGAFLKAYYRWMETSNDSAVIAQSKSLLSYNDIDSTSQAFIQYYINDFLPYFPNDVVLDERKLVKAARNFYQKKGSVESIQFLFRVLYGKEADIYYPKNNILRASDGKWTQPQVLRLLATANNDSFNVNQLVGRLGLGSVSNASCIIESVNRTVDPGLGIELIELYISNVENNFSDVENLNVVYGFDSNNNPLIFSEPIIAAISAIDVDPNNRGLYYQGTTYYANGSVSYPGDPVVISGGLQPSDPNAKKAIAYVGNVTTGGITGINVVFGGYGYANVPNTLVSIVNAPNDFTGHGANIIIETIDTANAVYLNLNTDSLYYKNANTLADTDFGFAANTGINANSTLANAFSYANIGFSPILQMELISGGYNYRAVPTVELQDVFYTDLDNNNSGNAAFLANNFGYVDDFGYICAVEVINGGTGYSNVTDQIVVPSAIGYNASFDFIAPGSVALTTGQLANIFSFANNTLGALTYYDPQPVSLTQNIAFSNTNQFNVQHTLNYTNYSLTGNTLTLAAGDHGYLILDMPTSNNFTIPQGFISCDINGQSGWHAANNDNDVGVGLWNTAANGFLGVVLTKQSAGPAYFSITWNANSNILINPTVGHIFQVSGIDYLNVASLGMSVVGQSVSGFAKYYSNSNSWTYIGNATFVSSNLTSVGAMSSWSPSVLAHSQLNSGNPITEYTNVLNLKMGSFGGIAMRDMEVVTNPNGSPYQANANGPLIQFTATVSDPGAQGYFGVFTLNTSSGALTQNSAILFNRSNNYFCDVAGQIINYGNGNSQVLITSWGNGFAGNINVFTLQTNTQNLLVTTAPTSYGVGVGGLRMLQLPFSTAANAGAYDPMMAYDTINSKWIIAYTAVSNTNFAGNPFGPALANSSDLISFTTIGHDTTNTGFEGTRIIPFNNTWIITAGGKAGSGNGNIAYIYDSSLNWLCNVHSVGGFNGVGNTQPHAMIFTIPTTPNTSFMLTFNGNAFDSTAFTWGTPIVQTSNTPKNILANSTITQVLILNRGEGYIELPVNLAVVNKANHSVASAGIGATLRAFGFGQGANLNMSVSAVGEVEDVSLVSRGFDYISKPNVSLRVADFIINPIPNNASFVTDTLVYQGANAQVTTWRAYVDSYNVASSTLRVYNYEGTLNVSATLVTNTVNSAINTNVAQPVIIYGNGLAKANAIFLNGLIQYPGFYLNSDGFLSADQYLQDSKTYHNYSYKIVVEEALLQYRNLLLQIAHPLGTSMLGTFTVTDQKGAMITPSGNVNIIPTINAVSNVSCNAFYPGTPNVYADYLTGANTNFIANTYMIAFPANSTTQALQVKRILALDGSGNVQIESNTAFAYYPVSINTLIASANTISGNHFLGNIAPNDIIGINNAGVWTYANANTVTDNLIYTNAAFLYNVTSTVMTVYPTLLNVAYVIINTAT